MRASVDCAVDPAAALREHFGFDAFRPGQEEAVRGAIGPPARDVLVVMPTGAGKSLCYQLPALVRDDLTLVVSPLVSLMQDQVDALEAIAPGKVALVNAQRDGADNRAALERAAAGELRLLYVAPERFSSAPFLEAMKGVRIGLFVVDEAHCVSQWGHDFRPDYFRLADAARWLEAEAIIASTATATPQVARDIEVAARACATRCASSTGFDRPNLSFAVIPCTTATVKHRHIAAALAAPGATPAIVYAGTRAGAEKLAPKLSARSTAASASYHAGLGREQRAAVQRQFMDGELAVVVATNAFGMGIDKSDVRSVCHENVPGSIEAYYQEAGRAGRDGRPARALLFAENRDKGLHVFFIQRGGLSDQAITTVAHRLQARATDGRYDIGADELAAILGARGEESDQVRSVIGHLVRAGVVRPAPSSPDRVRGRIEGPFDARARAACRASAADGQRARWRQYRAVWAFVEGSACRRRTILRHFGDRQAPAPDPGVPCCDVCDPSWVPPAPAKRSRRAAGGGAPFGAGRVAHGDLDLALDTAILQVVAVAAPAVGRTRAVEILRGGRAKELLARGYDGLPEYGTFDHLSAADVLARIDELIEAGRLRSTGGAFPKLEPPPAASVAAAEPPRHPSPPPRHPRHPSPPHPPPPLPGARPRSPRRWLRPAIRSASACSPPARGRTCRRCSTACTARRPWSSASLPTGRRRRRSSARRRWGSRPGSSCSPSTRTARRATGDGRLDERARRRAGRARRLHGDPHEPLPAAASPARSSTSTRRCCRPSPASARSSRRSTTA